MGRVRSARSAGCGSATFPEAGADAIRDERRMPMHPTAVIDSQAEIDPSAEIGPYVVISGPVRVAAGAVVGPHAHLLGRTTIGPGCRLHTGVIVGDLPQDRAYKGSPTECHIGAETILREYVTVHRGTAEGTSTIVGERCFVMAHAHIGHNCCVGDDVMLVNGSLLGGYVVVGCRAVISGNAAVHQFVRVGELAMIAGLAKIVQDVPPFMMVDGPGWCVGVNVIGMRRAGMDPAERREVKAMYRRLYCVPTSLNAAIEEFTSTVQTEAGRRILHFLQNPSRRGIGAHGGPRSRNADNAEDDGAAGE